MVLNRQFYEVWQACRLLLLSSLTKMPCPIENTGFGIVKVSAKESRKKSFFGPCLDKTMYFWEVSL